VSNTDPLWQRYEYSVSRLLAAMDRDARVAHNKWIDGHLSQVRRQVDVLVQGTVVGLDITIAVECKRYRRPVGIERIDQFVGKLLDLAADRGILYSYSGFSESAVCRAMGSRNPNVLPVALETPREVIETRGVPGYPIGGLFAPQWVEELDTPEYQRFLETGEWSKFWS
jgi:hypothetical protein